MQVSFISIPYDLGRFASGMGRGPSSILDSFFTAQLRKAGHVVDTQTIVCVDHESLTDLQLTFKLNSLLAQAVTEARARRFFPIILAGNCITTVGTYSGLHDKRIGVLWLDAHGDFNTPETTQTGYLDGMALSAACGRCWKTLIASDQSYTAIDEERVVLLGARDIDPAEANELKGSRVSVVSVENLRQNSWSIPEFDRSRIKDLYIHFDADVLDVSIGRANRFASANGLLRDDLKRIFSLVTEDFRLKAIALTAYNPEFDTEGTVRKELRTIILSVLESANARKQMD